MNHSSKYRIWYSTLKMINKLNKKLKKKVNKSCWIKNGNVYCYERIFDKRDIRTQFTQKF